MGLLAKNWHLSEIQVTSGESVNAAAATPQAATKIAVAAIPIWGWPVTNVVLNTLSAGCESGRVWMNFILTDKSHRADRTSIYSVLRLTWECVSYELVHNTYTLLATILYLKAVELLSRSLWAHPQSLTWYRYQIHCHTDLYPCKGLVL